MENFISLKELIKTAKKDKIDLGTGDPYNRLRYYTKMGWMPHMTRKVNKRGGVEGHYPVWALDTLRKIQELRDTGQTNEDISKKIKANNSLKKVVNSIFEEDSKKRFVTYGIVGLIALILIVEFGFIRINKPKSLNTSLVNPETLNIQLLDSGTAFIPKDNKKVFVKVGNIQQNSKVYVTFKESYSPASRYWVSSIKELEGFTVELDTPVSNTVDFYWWVSN
ncbi:hypothetical protein A3K42_00180 [candidate division WWE3 bacterium RBG_13_37_7]|uniref:HTH merR-type domain-containing protein n=1 Tax=candidate division WWE3 bacterium RBG_13_37_7 TaxID=1802609 RepID=A0A1F4U331_UNCKA|nr:MAG: hypothetical protein A3K42_00180 [candidate division WWE3 bacterium RBG_13_37_7]